MPNQRARSFQKTLWKLSVTRESQWLQLTSQTPCTFVDCRASSAFHTSARVKPFRHGLKSSSTAAAAAAVTKQIRSSDAACFAISTFAHEPGRVQDRSVVPKQKLTDDPHVVLHADCAVEGLRQLAFCRVAHRVQVPLPCLACGAGATCERRTLKRFGNVHTGSY